MLGCVAPLCLVRSRCAQRSGTWRPGSGSAGRYGMANHVTNGEDAGLGPRSRLRGIDPVKVVA